MGRGSHTERKIEGNNKDKSKHGKSEISLLAFGTNKSSPKRKRGKGERIEKRKQTGYI